MNDCLVPSGVLVNRVSHLQMVSGVTHDILFLKWYGGCSELFGFANINLPGDEKRVVVTRMYMNVELCDHCP